MVNIIIIINEIEALIEITLKDIFIKLLIIRLLSLKSLISSKFNNFFILNL